MILQNLKFAGLRGNFHIFGLQFMYISVWIICICLYLILVYFINIFTIRKINYKSTTLPRLNLSFKTLSRFYTKYLQIKYF